MLADRVFGERHALIHKIFIGINLDSGLLAGQFPLCIYELSNKPSPLAVETVIGTIPCKRLFLDQGHPRNYLWRPAIEKQVEVHILEP